MIYDIIAIIGLFVALLLSPKVLSGIIRPTEAGVSLTEISIWVMGICMFVFFNFMV